MRRVCIGNTRHVLSWQAGGRGAHCPCVACLAEGLGIRATARVFEVDAKTVLQWLVEAAEHLRAFCAYFLCNVHVNEVQLDGLYAVLRQVQDGSLSENDAIARLERSPYWVWTAGNRP